MKLTKRLLAKIGACQSACDTIWTLYEEDAEVTVEVITRLLQHDVAVEYAVAVIADDLSYSDRLDILTELRQACLRVMSEATHRLLLRVVATGDPSLGDKLKDLVDIVTEVADYAPTDVEQVLTMFRCDFADLLREVNDPTDIFTPMAEAIFHVSQYPHVMRAEVLGNYDDEEDDDDEDEDDDEDKVPSVPPRPLASYLLSSPPERDNYTDDYEVRNEPIV